MLTRNHRQEALCRAYVQAVAALAGVGSSVPTPDYGVDLTLRLIEDLGGPRQDAGVVLDLQLRSTTRASLTDSHVAYDLDVRTYDRLRSSPPVARLLVVMVLPEDEEYWLSQTVEEMVIRHCAYWFSLRGAEPSAAASRIRVAIPREQLLSVRALRALLGRVAQGELP